MILFFCVSRGIDTLGYLCIQVFEHLLIHWPHQETGVEQFPDHETSAHFGFLWMLRPLVKWHLGVTEQFIWKHISVVQERMKVIEIPSE